MSIRTRDRLTTRKLKIHLAVYRSEIVRVRPESVTHRRIQLGVEVKSIFFDPRFRDLRTKCLSESIPGNSVLAYALRELRDKGL